jgi:hypothetical protein
MVVSAGFQELYSYHSITITTYQAGVWHSGAWLYNTDPYCSLQQQQAALCLHTHYRNRLYSYIYGLYSDAVSSPGCKAWNDTMIIELLLEGM